MLPLVDSQRTSAAVAAAVLCVFVLVCLLIIRNGKTKLKSRYGHMILTIVVAFVILIRMYPLDSGGEIVPAAVAVRRASDEVFKIQGEAVVVTMAKPEVKQKTKGHHGNSNPSSPRPAAGGSEPRVTILRESRRNRQKAREVRRNLFIELKKIGGSVEKYLHLTAEENETSLVPAVPSSEAQSRYKDHLPWWEAEEILFYPSVWYIGVRGSKIKYDPEEVTLNFGFDEWENDDEQDEGDERMLRISTGDHLEYRYEIVRKLGSGSYGRVVLARDHAKLTADVNYEVAIKVLHNESRAAKYFKQECGMMSFIENHTQSPQLYTKLLRAFFFRNHFFIVLELLGKSMFREINEPIQDMKLLSTYMKDILVPLENLHQINIVHGDLKPENLMTVRGCNRSCSPMVKLADFNLACTPLSNQFPCPGVYFQTRHYRAPEVILDLNYTVQADMWSVGVIAAELFLGSLPFYGETTTDQLAATMEVFGLIPSEMIKHSPRIQTFQKAVNYKCKNGFRRRPYRKSLGKIMRKAPEVLLKFVSSCLQLDPSKRITSKEALEHSFLKLMTTT